MVISMPKIVVNIQLLLTYRRRHSHIFLEHSVYSTEDVSCCGRTFDKVTFYAEDAGCCLITAEDGGNYYAVVFKLSMSAPEYHPVIIKFLSASLYFSKRGTY